MKAHYFEDFSKAAQGAFRHRRMEDLLAIGDMDFPLTAEWGRNQDPVRVLGPSHRFPPYDDGESTWKDNFQLLCEYPDGTRAILMAKSIYVNDRPLLLPVPPRRPWDFMGG